MARCRLAQGLGAALLGTVGFWTNAAFADGITVGDPALIPYTLPFGDFNVISLQWADQATGSNTYFIQSSPGQLHNDVVIGTGPGTSFYNGNIAGNNGVPGMDNPYATPNNVPGSLNTSTYFRTGNTISSPEPLPGGGQFPGDTINSWDTTVAALLTATNQRLPVFYFNLNENGVPNVLSGTDLLVWAKVTLYNGTSTPDGTFYLAGNPFDPAGFHNGANLSALPPGPGTGPPDETASYPDVPTGSPYDPADPRWTLVHGDICVNGSVFLHFGTCTSSDVSTATPVHQNLGANQAAFAAYSPGLDAALSLFPNDTIQIDWRMADLDNGYEQLFILASGEVQPVPEPASIAMLGFGLVGLGFALRRRKREVNTAA